MRAFTILMLGITAAAWAAEETKPQAAAADSKPPQLAPAPAPAAPADANAKPGAEAAKPAAPMSLLEAIEAARKNAANQATPPAPLAAGGGAQPGQPQDLGALLKAIEDAKKKQSAPQ